MATWNSQTESARILKVAEPTLRTWIKKFRPYVISRPGPGPHPEYEIERLRLIHYLVTDWGKNPVNRSLSEIGRELARRFPVEATAGGVDPLPEPDFETLGAASEQPTSTPVVPPSWEDALAAMALVPEALAGLEGELASARGDLADLILLARDDERAVLILTELKQQRTALAADRAEQRAAYEAILAHLQQQQERRTAIPWHYLSPFVLFAMLRSFLTAPWSERDDDEDGDEPAPSQAATPRALVAPGRVREAAPTD